MQSSSCSWLGLEELRVGSIQQLQKGFVLVLGSGSGNERSPEGRGRK